MRSSYSIGRGGAAAHNSGVLLLFWLLLLSLVVVGYGGWLGQMQYQKDPWKSLLPGAVHRVVGSMVRQKHGGRGMYSSSRLELIKDSCLLAAVIQGQGWALGQ